MKRSNRDVQFRGRNTALYCWRFQITKHLPRDEDDDRLVGLVTSPLRWQSERASISQGLQLFLAVHGAVDLHRVVPELRETRLDLVVGGREPRV